MSCLGMRRHLLVLSYFVGLGIGLVPFTNCDSYTESEAFKELNSANISEPDENCSTGVCSASAAASQLRITPAYSQIDVTATPQVILGGSCSSGSFANNKVTWQILYNQAVYSNASGPFTSAHRCSNGQPCGQAQYSKCQGEMFDALVSLPTVAGTYEIQFDIVGLDEFGASYTNALTGRSKITLVVH
jgi:hypothetical protein